VQDALPGWKWEPVGHALMSLRGVQVLTAMTLVAELGDFRWFEDSRSLMHFFGLTPSEHSSSDKRVQGGIKQRVARLRMKELARLQKAAS
jgi:transposase